MLFLAYFSVSKKRNIKRSPKNLKLHGTYFWTRRSPWSIRDGPEESRGHHEGVERALPPGCAFLPRGCLVDPPDLFPVPTPLIYPQTSRTELRSGVPLPQAGSHQKPIGTLFRHPAGGGIHHRWPSSSSRSSP